MTGRGSAREHQERRKPGPKQNGGALVTPAPHPTESRSPYTRSTLPQGQYGRRAENLANGIRPKLRLGGDCQRGQGPRDQGLCVLISALFPPAWPAALAGEKNKNK